MDSMVQAYMEETEEMLQKAEKCIIRLEMEYSSDDIDELFRIAHTIKGSSHMVGYEDIGNLMHKIEDMLDCARSGTIPFDQRIVSLCFEGLDMVTKVLQYKKEQVSQDIMDNLANEVFRINKMVEVFIRDNKNEKEKFAIEQPEIGIVSLLLNKKPIGRNKYYITFFIEEDAPMVSPVLIMILQSVEDIGTLVYSSITDKYFSGQSGDNEIKIFDFIICTDIDEFELYTYFELCYVEKINIVELTRSKLEGNNYYFDDIDNAFHIIILRAFMKVYNLLLNQPKKFKINKEELCMLKSFHQEAVSAFGKMKSKNKISRFVIDFNELYSFIIKIYSGQVKADEKLYDNIQTQMAKLMERAYNFIKGKHMFYIFKSGKSDFVSRLRNFTGMVNKSSTFIILIDFSGLTILNENEIKALIEIKKQLEAQNIEIGIIANVTDSRKIINIFDSIKSVEEFKVFGSELEAILDILHSEELFYRISKSVKE